MASRRRKELRRLCQFRAARRSMRASGNRWDTRWSIPSLSVVAPLFLGTIAALVFDSKLPMRGLVARYIRHADDGDARRGRSRLDDDVSPATGGSQLSAVADWHSAAGVDIPSGTTVIPSLVLVETWQWTPLVMLIVLGGLAAMPREPFESAEIDGANALAEIPLHHLSDDRAVHDGGGDHPLHRCAEKLRHHLRHDAGRARAQRRKRSISISTTSPSPTTTLAMARPSPSSFSSSSSPCRLSCCICASGPSGTTEGRRNAASQTAQLVGHCFLVFVIVSPAMLFFLWMLSLSLKYEIDNAAYPPIFIPEQFAWKNYSDVFAANDFLHYFFNSLLVTGTRDDAGAAHRRACRLRHRPHEGDKAAIVIMIARMTPGLSYLIPLFLLFQWLACSARCCRRSSPIWSSRCRSSSGS